MAAKIQKKSLDSSPDETRTFEKGKIELANLGDVTIGRGILEPGWSWEKCVKPIAKTNSCQAAHTQYVVSGRIKVVMDDGTEEEFGPGDAAVIPPGHNASSSSFFDCKYERTYIFVCQCAKKLIC